MNRKNTSLDWYYKNREYQMQKHREWLKENKEHCKEYNKSYLKKNRDKILEKKKQYRLQNQTKIKAYRRKIEVRKRERIRMRLRRAWSNHVYDHKYYQQNREKRLAYYKQHSQKPEVKARRRLMERLRNKKNPRSNRGLPLDLQLSMNNVRLRDKNTCQWQGCHLTFREAPIHVHHIFPRSEYPELQYEEKYMICYCANHHVMFHRLRGDLYSEMIGQRSYEDPIQGRINV